MSEKLFTNSSQVIRIRSWKNNLTVDFKTGGTYTYLDVDKKDLEDAFEAGSIGRFIHKVLKVNYQCKKETKESVVLIDNIIKKENNKHKNKK